MMPKDFNVSLKQILWLIAIGGGYAIAAKAGLYLATLHQNASPVWPASGISVAATLYLGPIAALAIWPASFIINYLIPTPVGTSILIATGNTLEPLFAAFLFRALMRSRSEWSLVMKVSALPAAAIAASGLSAAFGSTALLLIGSLPHAGWAAVFSTWWIGNLLGIVVCAPILLWRQQNLQLSLFARGRVLESSLFVFSGIGILSLCFLDRGGFNFLFVIFPYILWGAIRFGPLEIRLITLITAFVSIAAVTLGLGPFTKGTLNNNLLSLQLFVLSVALTGLALAELRQLKKLRLSIVVLLATWMATGIAFTVLQRTIEQENQNTFTTLVHDAHRQLDSRERAYVDILTASVSFIHSSAKVTGTEWERYVSSLLRSDRYPGILSMGVIEPVERAVLQKFINTERKRGRSDFDFKFPEANTGSIPDYASRELDHYLIRFIAPESNEPRIAGTDLGASEVRRKALDLARDLAKPVASGQIKLQRFKDTREGFFLAMPFYQGDAVPISMDERRDSIKGWVFASFLTDEFFKASLHNFDRRLEYAVFENSPNGIPVALYPMGSRRTLSSFEKTTYYVLGEREFRIGWSRSHSMTPLQDSTAAWVAACGALIGILLAIILSSLQDLGERAEAIAREKTALLTQRETELTQAKQRLQTLIDSSPVAILATDKFNNVKLWNPACEKLFGWTAEEALGKWIPFVPKDKTEESLNNIEKIRSSRVPVRFQAERQHKDGSKLITSTALMPLYTDNGEFDGVMGVATDRTEETAALEALERQRALAVQSARMAALGEMASGIAHEINNPLAIITVHSGMLIEHLATNDELDRKRLFGSLNKIESVSFRIAKIINGLLSFARDPKNEPSEICSISTVVQDALEICAERFKANNVDLRIAIGENVDVNCSRSQLSQVILNLLNNAFDAVLGSEDAWVQLEAKNLGSTIQIRVIDSGRGIPGAIADKIMEPFFTTKEVGRGTGLGLSISKGIVENHNGKLRLDRSSAHTCFVIELPIPDGPEVNA